MRKEKSRDAARSRRGKENHEFYELAKMLPLPAAITSQLGNALLDKASIIRLTISYLKLRDFAMNGEPSWTLNVNGNSNALKCNKNCNLFDLHQGTHILQSLDGFAFALGQDGRFLYISETVSIYLGLSQVEMTGSSVFDYTHQQDHAELAEQLGISNATGSHHHHHQHHHLSSSPLPPASVGSSASNESDTGTPYSSSANLITASSPNDTMERQFCIRMKSTLTKRGCQHFKSSGYRVVHIIAHLRPEINQHQHHQQQQHQRRDSAQGSNGLPKIIGLVAIAIALPPPSINELRLESDMFVTRLSLDFRIAHCEPRVCDLLDYTAEELTGRSLYSLIHGQDVMLIRKCHLDLIHKGQVMSGYYRWINKNGGFTWVQTCATLICSNNSNSKSTASTTNNTSSSSNSNDEQEQSIICVNYVLSLIEYSDVIMDASQLAGGLHMIASSSSSSSSLTKRTPACATITKQSSPEPSPTESNSQNSLSQNGNSHSSHSHNSQITAATNSHSTNSQQTVNGSPDSDSIDRVNEGAKRRRFNSSPVRPWKSPSPPTQVSHITHQTNQTGASGGSPGTGSNLNVNVNSASNLLRHISVIRETPPILKPQVVPPAYHPHHYHHLVDPYAAAYHLYKNGGTGGVMAASSHPTPTGPSPATHHHWGYN